MDILPALSEVKLEVVVFDTGAKALVRARNANKTMKLYISNTAGNIEKKWVKGNDSVNR